MGPTTLPSGRMLHVRGADGTRLHTEVFGPDDGYPIVLAHGITCNLQVWREQIADLSRDYRVIAFDHRGHGRSSVPPRTQYTLDHLAADVDAVLDATVASGERAVLAGHSMGGIAISAWSHRFRDKVHKRVDGVALINTTTGDIIRQVKFLPLPRALSAGRVAVGSRIVRHFGGIPTVSAAAGPSRRFVAALAVGRDADPEVAAFVYDMFHRTPRNGRGGAAAMLMDALEGSHLSLDGLTVPTVVIGSSHDRLLPIAASRRIAATVPNLLDLVELPGGHCAILERPAEVNAQLRRLAEAGAAGTSVSS